LLDNWICNLSEWDSLEQIEVYTLTWSFRSDYISLGKYIFLHNIPNYIELDYKNNRDKIIINVDKNSKKLKELLFLWDYNLISFANYKNIININKIAKNIASNINELKITLYKKQLSESLLTLLFNKNINKLYFLILIEDNKKLNDKKCFFSKQITDKILGWNKKIKLDLRYCKKSIIFEDKEFLQKIQSKKNIEIVNLR
jgi:hypothetical protein